MDGVRDEGADRGKETEEMQYEYIGTHDIYFWITYEKY
jgi:hypothetical protein